MQGDRALDVRLSLEEELHLWPGLDAYLEILVDAPMAGGGGKGFSQHDVSRDRRRLARTVLSLDF